MLLTGHSRPRFLIVGCGGIGGVVASHLLVTGHDVTVLCRSETVRAALLTRGFEVRGATSLHRVAASRVIAKIPADEPQYDCVLLCTQPPEVEDAARSVLPFLGNDSRVICLQNGLCEPRVGKIVGEHRVLGAVVMWGASMPEPGVFDRTSTGGFVLGALVPNAQAELTALGEALSCVGPVVETQNLLGARWSKLAINCAISTLGTIAGQRLGPLMMDARARRLALEIITEVISVAHAEGVTLERVPGLLDVRLLSLKTASAESVSSAARALRHALLLAMGLRYRRLRSSMLAAIERSRPAAVNFLNGEVVERAEAHGVSVPVNRAAVAAVLQIAATARQPSWAALGALYGATRPGVTHSAKAAPATAQSEEQGES